MTQILLLFDQQHFRFNPFSKHFGKVILFLSREHAAAYSSTTYIMYLKPGSRWVAEVVRRLTTPMSFPKDERPKRLKKLNVNSKIQ